jgi:hypothetical protein
MPRHKERRQRQLLAGSHAVTPELVAALSTTGWVIIGAGLALAIVVAGLHQRAASVWRALRVVAVLIVIVGVIVELPEIAAGPWNAQAGHHP